jgi:hypothetical protein
MPPREVDDIRLEKFTVAPQVRRHFDHPILSEEARLGLWASEAGYVPPLLVEAADEPEGTE